jgi:phosphoglycerate-specific signal transduction histidine kinase
MVQLRKDDKLEGMEIVRSMSVGTKVAIIGSAITAISILTGWVKQYVETKERMSRLEQSVQSLTQEVHMMLGAHLETRRQLAQQREDVVETKGVVRRNTAVLERTVGEVRKVKRDQAIVAEKLGD